MSFTDFADSAQLTILTTALNEHCLEQGISDESERNQIAKLVMSLFSGGARSGEDIKAGLYGVSDRRVAYRRQQSNTA